jgi:hypothetical protein
MNLKIEIELSFEDTRETLEEILVDLADVLKKHGYGNIDDDDTFVKSFIRVKKIDDDEVIILVIPMKDEQQEEE